MDVTFFFASHYSLHNPTQSTRHHGEDVTVWFTFRDWVSMAMRACGGVVWNLPETGPEMFEEWWLSIQL